MSWIGSGSRIGSKGHGHSVEVLNQEGELVGGISGMDMGNWIPSQPGSQVIKAGAALEAAG